MSVVYAPLSHARRVSLQIDGSITQRGRAVQFCCEVAKVGRSVLARRSVACGQSVSVTKLDKGPAHAH